MSDKKNNMNNKEGMDLNFRLTDSEIGGVVFTSSMNFNPFNKLPLTPNPVPTPNPIPPKKS